MLEDLKLDPLYDGFLFLAEAARNPPSLRSHHHVELELNVVANGSITYVAGRDRFTFGRRSLLWMFPAQEHQLVDRTPDAQYYVAVFKPDLIARSCHSAAYRGLKRKTLPGRGLLHTTLDPESFDFLRRMMDHMLRGSLDPDLLNREAGFGVASDFRYRHDDPDALNAGLHHLLLLAWRFQTDGGAKQRPVALHPAIAKAIALMSEGASGDSLPELARRCGLSEGHLSRTFRRQVGVPISRYRNSVRLGRFWECLRKPGRPTVMEAALEAGFGSYAQFFKVFSASYGEGPRSCLRAPRAPHL